MSTEAPKPVPELPGFGIKIIDAPKFTVTDSSEDLLTQENNRREVLSEQRKTQSSGGESANDGDVKEKSSTGSPLLDLVPDNLKSK